MDNKIPALEKAPVPTQNVQAPVPTYDSKASGPSDNKSSGPSDPKHSASKEEMAAVDKQIEEQSGKKPKAKRGKKSSQESGSESSSDTSDSGGDTPSLDHINQELSTAVTNQYSIIDCLDVMIKQSKEGNKDLTSIKEKIIVMMGWLSPKQKKEESAEKAKANKKDEKDKIKGNNELSKNLEGAKRAAGEAEDAAEKKTEGKEAPEDREAKIEGDRSQNQIITLLRKIEENTRGLGGSGEGKEGGKKKEKQEESGGPSFLDTLMGLLPRGLSNIGQATRLAWTGAKKLGSFVKSAAPKAGRALMTGARAAGRATLKVGGMAARGLAAGAKAVANSKAFRAVAGKASEMGKGALRMINQGRSKDAKGRWRNKKGQFAKKPMAAKVVDKSKAMVSKLSGMFKKTPSAVATKATAGAAGAASKSAAGVVAKNASKVAGKSLLKSAVKKIPIIGALAGLGFAASRAMSGDWTGAALEAGSGIAGSLPGLGTAASVGMDAALAARDMMKPDVSSDMAKNLSAVNSLGTQTDALETAKAAVESTEEKKSDEGGSNVTNITNNNSAGGKSDSATRIFPRNPESTLQRYFSSRQVVAA